MEIIPIMFDKNKTNKPEIENVEKEKMEYTLLGTFQRTRGLKLFAYNYLDDIVSEIKIKPKSTLNIKIENNKCIPSDEAPEEATVDNRFIHFEALNMKNAIRRLNKYKSGKLKELCNLRKPNPKNVPKLPKW